jgi:hypothetical protein
MRLFRSNSWREYNELQQAANIKDVNFPITDPEKIKLIPRFVADDVVENLEQGRNLTIGQERYERIATESRWRKITDNQQEQQQYANIVELKEIIEAAKTTQLELDRVPYFKRSNVGGKTRWYKLVDEPKQSHGVLCNVQGIESDAQTYFLQALLVQMDNKLHQRFEECLEQANTQIPLIVNKKP